MKKRLSYERRKQLYGYGFLSLWMLGTFQYFVRPLINLIRFSLADIKLNEKGYELVNFGLTNYNYILRVDPKYLRNLIDSVIQLFYQVPVIIVFSCVIALILNQKFFGRTVVRAVFFVPVIVASGVVISILNGDAMSQMLMRGDKSASSMLQMANFGYLLYQFGLPRELVDPIVEASSNVFNLSWKSGVQILILLAGLQTISPSLYEASSIDGATGWEKLWKITIPMLSPMLILVLIYTIIDSFTDFGNVLMRDIVFAARQVSVSRAGAMAAVYFCVIMLVIGIVYKVVNKFVFYTNEN